MRTIRFSPVASLLVSLLGVPMLLAPLQLRAQSIALDPGVSIEDTRTGWAPYLFATDSLGTAVGVAAFSSGRRQPQLSLFGAGFVTSNDSSLISGALGNLRFADSRFFMDAFVLADHFTDQRFYGYVEQDPLVRGGSNDSDANDFVTGISDELTTSITFKFRAPIGNIADDPLAVYDLREGLVEAGPAGGDTWNPRTSGQTTFAIGAFSTYRDLRDFTMGPTGDDIVEELLVAETNGLEFWVEYDNTDFPRNPSRGSRQLIKFNRDFGWGNSSNSWTNIEADMTKYVDLGRSNGFLQRVVALNLWVSDTSTWRVSPEAPNDIAHRPPPGYGSRLGGFDRLRGYPSGRFHDKAAAYFGAELRLIPRAQPLGDLPVLRRLEIDWWQVVPFVEAGRVGPKVDSDLFLKDLKWDVGIGLRLMTFRLPVRVDVAFSEEGSSIWAMFAQPFARQGD